MNEKLNFIDLVDILSLIIGLQNLDMNITQNDLQEETQRLDEKVDLKIQHALRDIHRHLEQQDAKINTLLERTNK